MMVVVLRKLDYTIIKSEHPYGKKVVALNGLLDPIYEAKAYEWIIKNINLANNKVLLWIVGRRSDNSQLLKTIKYEEVMQ